MMTHEFVLMTQSLCITDGSSEGINYNDQSLVLNYKLLVVVLLLEDKYDANWTQKVRQRGLE